MRRVPNTVGELAMLRRVPRAPARSGAAVLVVLTCLVAGCATAPPASRIASPLVERLQVQAIRITPVDVEGVAVAESAWLADLIGATATTAARRHAVELALASTLVDSADPGAGAAFRLSGELRLPLSLPTDARGSWAAFRDGELARAHLSLVGPNSQVVAESAVGLDWDDVRWTTGGPKMRRARRPEAALVDAAEKAVALAVRDIAWRMEERRRSSPPSAGTATPRPAAP